MPFSVPVQEARRPRRSAALRDLRLRQLRHKGLRNIQVFIKGKALNQFDSELSLCLWDIDYPHPNEALTAPL